MIESHSPELLYLLSGAPAELAALPAHMRPWAVAGAVLT